MALVAEGNDDGAALLALLKRDPGAVGLDSLLTEVNKLHDVRRLGLREGQFADCSEKLVAAWWARAIKMYPSDFRGTAEGVRIWMASYARTGARLSSTTRAASSASPTNPTGLQAVKDEVVRRWGALDLLDVLKNADFGTGFTDEFASVATYERIGRAVLQRRLFLALFALATNMGIRAIVATGESGAALRHVRRHCITVDNLRAAVRKLVNATFVARDTAWWGQGHHGRRT